MCGGRQATPAPRFAQLPLDILGDFADVGRPDLAVEDECDDQIYGWTPPTMAGAESRDGLWEKVQDGLYIGGWRRFPGPDASSKQSVDEEWDGWDGHSVLYINGDKHPTLPKWVLEIQTLSTIIFDRGKVVLPDWTAKMKNLKGALWRNADRLVPNVVRHWSGLESIALPWDLLEMPVWLSTLPNLRELYAFGGDSGQVIVDGIRGMSQLRVLQLSETNVCRLPSYFADLEELEALYLRTTEIEVLPSFLEAFKKLKVLELDEILTLDELPDGLGELTSLQCLSLAQVHVRKLPDSMQKLSNLRTLDISGTDLKEVPSWLGDLVALENLYLRRICAPLPRSLANLRNLKLLDLESTSLQQVPAFVFELCNLKYLDLSGNPLHEIPANVRKLRRLESLVLAQTNIAELPDALASLNHLSRLELEGTPLSTIPEFLTKALPGLVDIQQ